VKVILISIILILCSADNLRLYTESQRKSMLWNDRILTVSSASFHITYHKNAKGILQRHKSCGASLMFTLLLSRNLTIEQRILLKLTVHIWSKLF